MRTHIVNSVKSDPKRSGQKGYEGMNHIFSSLNSKVPLPVDKSSTTLWAAYNPGERDLEREMCERDTNGFIFPFTFVTFSPSHSVLLDLVQWTMMKCFCGSLMFCYLGCADSFLSASKWPGTIVHVRRKRSMKPTHNANRAWIKLPVRNCQHVCLPWNRWWMLQLYWLHAFRKHGNPINHDTHGC